MQPFDECLRRTLRHRGCSPAVITRLLRELEDHRADLIQEAIESGLSKEEASAFAQAKLGEAESIATQFVKLRQRRDWWGRHPRLLFGLGPLLVFVAGFILSGLLLALVGQVEGWWQQPQQVGSATRMGITLLVPVVQFVLVLAIPALACRLASYYCYGWRWALVACLVLSLHCCFHFVTVDMPSSGHGQFTWGYNFSTHLSEHLSRAFPPFFVFGLYLLHLRGRLFQSPAPLPHSNISTT